MLQNFFNEKLGSGRSDGKSGGLSAKTLKNIKYMLHVALDQACYDKLISSNPVDGVRLPVPDGPEQRVLRLEEKERICAHAATIHTLPAQGVILLLTCGLRRGELLGLQWQDIDPESGIMKIRHTLSRLKKFDVTQSAYQYIQLDSYAPKTNRTAIYLGPVKTKKRLARSICRCGPRKPFLKFARLAQNSWWKIGLQSSQLGVLYRRRPSIGSQSSRRWISTNPYRSSDQKRESARHQAHLCHGSPAKDD